MIIKNISSLIGNTPLLNLNSLNKILSQFGDFEILLKCEHYNPGGSIKDRAALGMITRAIKNSQLKPGMTIVEGTAGNTGIGLALVGRSLGYESLIVMPKGQLQDKEKILRLLGAEIVFVEPVPFSNPNHFYRTAARIAQEQPEKFWWSNQFENLDNHLTHYETTGPEIFKQTNGEVTAVVASSGTGGTIAGVSKYLKEKNSDIKIYLVDPQGSGLVSFMKTGNFVAEGSSITEGIGIMRLVKNFGEAKIDNSFTLPDQDLVDIAYFLKQQEGLILGMSSALNIAGALKVACALSNLKSNSLSQKKRIVTFSCDLGERSFNKLYNPEFLKEKKLTTTLNYKDSSCLDFLIQKYKSESNVL